MTSTDGYVQVIRVERPTKMLKCQDQRVECGRNCTDSRYDTQRSLKSSGAVIPFTKSKGIFRGNHRSHYSSILDGKLFFSMFFELFSCGMNIILTPKGEKRNVLEIRVRIRI